MRIFVTLVLSAIAAQAAELPVRQVILYKHGIGFFERAGRLGAGESARLDFKASEMNDVLKSLTLQEQGGGKISGLRYDSMDLLGRKLAEFPFKLGEAQALSAVLDQLKGARIELQVGGQTIAGAIVNGRLVPGDDKRPEREQVTLLMDSNDLRTVDLSTASAIRFTDAQLQQQFRDYLAALTDARSQDKRSVYIDSTDAKARDIVASYTIPAAVWKSSYRLILDAAGKPMLEGWAIVDNTTGEDWTKVTLALVSGRPISFISQLYAPRYINRPTAELPDDQAQGPVIHEGAFAAAPGGVIPGTGGAAPAVAAAPPPPAPMMMKSTARSGRMATAEMMSEVRPSSVAADTVSQAVGDLFEYRLAQPVTIRKNESAMLPFLQQTIEARKLLIYSSHASPHPTNAAELTNTSGKTLDGGPITIYDGGNYAGEALMETLKGGDKRLISYAVDLGTRVTETYGNKEDVVREVHASRGILMTRTAVEEIRTYTVRNVDQKPKTLIIEHPVRQGYTLLSQKPAEKTSSAYRFELKLAPGAETAFPVSEERVYDSSYQVSSLTPDVLSVYVRNKNIGDAGRRQLEQIANSKVQLAEADQQLRDIKDQITAATADEDRLRRNIESLNQVSSQQQLVQEYARKLAAQETQLAGLRDREAEQQKRRTAMGAEINRMITALSF
jgi:hypothetical protein